MRIIGLFILLVNFSLKAQLSGVINIYTAVSAINSSTITVTSTVGLAVNDKVLIIQMKGATIDITNTSNYGTISNYNDAGNFAFGTISSFPNLTTVVLTSSLSSNFTPGGTNRVQLVKVRTVNANATVTGNVTATAWNGTTGGVIAMEILGTLTINAGFRIDANGAGFRGGAVSGTSDGTAWCNWSDFRSSNIVAACYQGIYAQKGEGIAEDTGNDYGRGPLANGGGGSGEHNGGGGGGSNTSYGGDGGRQFSNCPYRRNGTGINCNTPAGGALQSNTCSPAAISSVSDVMVGGLGGKALTAGSSNNKIFMGGGGGGGQQNGAGGTSGGNGGGIIIISTTSVTNNSGFSDAIRANGATAANTTGNEGAGGGGGGGSIIIETFNFANAVTISAAGGNGGNAVTNNKECRGPGGGGGGGLIWLSGITTAPTNLTTNVLSGTSGSVVCSNAGVCGGVPPSAATLTCYSDKLFCAVTPTSNGNVQAFVNIPLPITLMNFSSICFDNYNQINWVTSSETNLQKFTVQKSHNAESWENIGTVDKINSSVFPKNYSFSDVYFSKGELSYYRLKIDYDSEKTEYSSIIVSNCKANLSLDFNAYYTSQFNIFINEVPLKLYIFNSLGQLLKEIIPSKEINAYYYGAESISEGIYIISAIYSNQVVSKKIQVIKN